MSKVLANLTEQERYLVALLTDRSGIDQFEFMIYDPAFRENDGLFRAWPFQYHWFRCQDPLVISQGSRSAGKSQSAVLSALAFPFTYPGQEMVITAPESVHLQALTDKIETMFVNNRIPREMLVRGVAGIKHKPFHCNFKNGARIMGRIPQRDGRGMKGCSRNDTPIPTANGIKRADEVVVGDKVINHQLEWADVTQVIHDVNTCYEVTDIEGNSIIVSWEHRFYGASKEGDDFSEMYFEEVDYLLEDSFFWAIPVDRYEGAGIHEERDGYLLLEVVSVKDVGIHPIVNIIVEDGHSVLTDNIMSHNVHPTVLLLDEGQDYSQQGFEELIETVLQGVEGAQWKVFGVTRGVRDKFYEYTNSDAWTVFRLPAMFRPTWNDEERALKESQYGKPDSPGYRRNVLGLHGDQNSSIFVLSRLMACCDVSHSSFYNESEYWNIEFDDSDVEDVGDIISLIDPPGTHAKYKNFWMGADIGWTLAPTVIVIFAEVSEKGKEPSLKLLGRITMRRIKTMDQADVFFHLINTYRPLAFAMDSTGAGLPLLELIQEKARTHSELNNVVDRIKGYNFSEKIVAEFDDAVEVDEDDPDGYKKAEIRKTVLVWATDVLRMLVDEKRLILPWDKELIGEFQGQTVTYAKDALDPYGRKRLYSFGYFHSLDACRMAALAFKQNAIEQFIKNQEDTWEAPAAIFL